MTEWREDKGSSGQAAPPKVGESSRFALSPREPSTLIFVPFMTDPMTDPFGAGRGPLYIVRSIVNIVE